MTTELLSLASDRLLAPNDLDADHLQRCLHGLMRPGIDAADLYFQRTRREHWALEDSVVKGAGSDIQQGVGVRAISGERTGLAYSENLDRRALEAAAGNAAAIVRQGQQGVQPLLSGRQVAGLYPAINPVDAISTDAKLALLHAADKAARAADSRVIQVMANLIAVEDTVMLAGTDGRYCADVRPLVRLNVAVIVEQDGRREQGSAGSGGRFGLDRFSAQQAEALAQEAVRIACVRLGAIEAPAGPMTVVLGPGWPGVLLHEAVGHGLEGDFNRKGSSAYSGRIGEKVASELCTIIDEGCIAERRGSLSIDDEGVPTQRTVLIENGILKGYLQDEHNARLMNTRSTGNGRRESYAHPVLPRMTNTYMAAGQDAPEDILKSVSKGLYAVNFEGGQVDITSGNFVFSASEAYLIENGRIGAPVRGATLIGNGPDALSRVSMVGNDLQLDPGIGVCGKAGQSVPVGVGQPTLRIDGLTVGGTGTA